MGTNEYCDVSELFPIKLIKVSFNKSHLVSIIKELHNLYKKNYPKSKDDLHILSKIYIDRMENIINPMRHLQYCFGLSRFLRKT